MAAYAAVASLAKTTNLNRYLGNIDLFSIEAEDKVRSVHEYALYLQSFLEDFPDKAKRWESRIRDLSHEAEECIEDFIWHRTQTHHQGKAPPNLQQQLQKVSEKLGLIAGEMMEERPFDFPAAVSSSSKLAPTGSEAVIGLDEDVMAIRGRLCGEPSDLHIIPIVGMGGIGKTTLARIVYNHSSIVDHFDCRAWITVSQEYSSQSSLRKILLGLLLESMNLLEADKENINDQLDKIDVSELETKVFQNLKYRRYLIVMDDVWSTQVLDDVRNTFPNDYNGSRIMLTTRQLDAANYCGSPLHDVRVLNDDQSWDLLKQKVFTNSNCPPHLEDIGKEIAQKCAGLPLAVVLVAGLLCAVNNTRDSWEEIARHVVKVVDHGLGEILSLSYTHLPHHLRPCFLHLGGFPEDENILASSLIKLWEAEGFLKYENDCDKSLEQQAEEYLEDLAKRNLVLVSSRKINGKIKSLSLHDMVRDVCIRKALEEKFLRVIDRSDDLQYLIDERRFSLRLSDINTLLVPSIRTILSFNLKRISMLLHILGRFTLLRVLHAASLNPQEFSFQVFELINLRYLALDGLNITSAISKLVNLETLIIHPTSDYPKYASGFTLPLEIWMMQQLKHIIIYDCCTLPHPTESSLPLRNLQTLYFIKDLVWSETMVQIIPNVRRLGLVYTFHQECNIHHLKNLLQLEKLQLNLSWKLFWAGQVPNFPTTLKKLSLVGGGFPWADMSIIGSLPNLQVLKLRDYACYGRTWETGDEEFPRLKYLVIETSCLQHWIMQSTSFPILERLELHACWDLREIPEEVGEIPTLELIDVRYCRKSVVESAKQIKEYQRSCGNDALQVQAQVQLRESKVLNSEITEPDNIYYIYEDFSIEGDIRTTTLLGKMRSQPTALALGRRLARQHVRQGKFEEWMSAASQSYLVRLKSASKAKSFAECEDISSSSKTNLKRGQFALEKSYLHYGH